MPRRGHGVRRPFWTSRCRCEIVAKICKTPRKIQVCEAPPQPLARMSGCHCKSRSTHAARPHSTHDAVQLMATLRGSSTDAITGGTASRLSCPVQPVEPPSSQPRDSQLANRAEDRGRAQDERGERGYWMGGAADVAPSRAVWICAAPCGQPQSV